METAIGKQSGQNRDAAGRFLSGGKELGVGRPKGVKHHLGRAFLEDLAQLWQEQGGDILKRVAKDDPVSLLRVVANLVPKELLLKVEREQPAIKDISPEDVAQLARLQELRLMAKEDDDETT